MIAGRQSGDPPRVDVQGPPVNTFFSRRRTGVSFIALVAVSVVMLAISANSVAVNPVRIGQSVVTGVLSVFRGIGGFFGDTWNSIAELRRVRQQLEQAQARLGALEQFPIDIVELRIENAQLREQLGFADTLTGEYLAAVVVARDPGNLFSTITINRGQRHGVRDGLAVVALQDGIQGLVGRVSGAASGTSQVLPITARASFVAARLRDTRYDGLVGGVGTTADMLLLEHVNQAARDAISFGEVVSTSGLGGRYPPGLQIGRVREVGGEAFENSLQILVKPIVDFDRLEYVFVLIDSGGAQ